MYIADEIREATENLNKENEVKNIKQVRKAIRDVSGWTPDGGTSIRRTVHLDLHRDIYLLSDGTILVTSDQTDDDVYDCIGDAPAEIIDAIEQGE